MKRIGIKIIAIFLTIIFFMNCGIVSIIPVFAISSEEKEEYINKLENELKNKGYQVAKIIQKQEITDWKAGDSLKEKVGNKWDIQFNKKEGIIIKEEVTKTYNFSECKNYTEISGTNDIVMMIVNNDEETDIVKEGTNIFVISVIYDLLGLAADKNNPQKYMAMGVVIIETESDTTNIDIIGENSVKVGGTSQLQAVITPSKGQEINWSTSDSSIVSVDSTGKIKGKKVGKAIITASVGEVSAEHEIEVKPIEVTSITIEGENTLYIGNQIELSAKVKPANATDKTIIWTSSDESIATVEEGIVKGIKEGKTIIIAKSGNVTEEYEVEVIGNNEEKEEIIITGEKSVQVEKSITLTATINGEIVSEGIIWTSSDEEIATVDENGIVYGKKSSEEAIIITAETENGAKKEFYITVKDTIPIENIKINGEKNQIREKEELQLSVIFAPTNATYKEVTWFSIDEEIVTVDENGKVNAKKTGEGVIIAITNNMKISTFKLTVIGENEEEEIFAESIKINGEKNQIEKDEEIQLEAIITPENTTNKEVKWISSNEEVAIVDEEGKVIGKKAGKTTIIAITSNMKISTYEINVVTEDVEEVFAESIKINGEKNKIVEDEALKLETIIIPENTTNKEVKWISSNEEVAIVDEEGKVIGKKAGKTTIIAMTNNMKMASYEINVVAEDAEEVLAESIKINGEKNKIEKNEELQLEAVITPENTTNKDVIWSSSNEDIAIVDENGKVIGKKAGFVNIKVTTKNLKVAEYAIEIIENEKTNVNVITELSEQEIKIEEKTTMKISLEAKELNSDIGAIYLKIEYPYDFIDITLIEGNKMKIMTAEEIEEETGESVEEGTIAIIPDVKIKEGETREILELEIEALVETEKANIKISDIVLKCMNGEEIKLNDVEKNILITEKKEDNEDDDYYYEDDDYDNEDDDYYYEDDDYDYINDNFNNKDESLYNGNLAHAGKNIISLMGIIFIAFSSFILYRKYKIF